MFQIQSKGFSKGRGFQKGSLLNQNYAAIFNGIDDRIETGNGDKDINVIILAGQSNMSGRPTGIDELEPILQSQQNAIRYDYAGTGDLNVEIL